VLPTRNAVATPAGGGEGLKEETEQKTLPASSKKLRDARRKGQVSRSRDIVAGVTLVVSVGYLLMAWTGVRDRILWLMEIVSAAPADPFARTSERAAALVVEILLATFLPLIALILLAGLVAGAIGTLGPVLSFDLVKPRFDHINPAKGFKRIFSGRTVIELFKSVAKVIVLAAAFWLVLSGSLQPLFETPVCGTICLRMMVIATAKPLAATAALGFLAIGIVDIVLQHRLFLHEMRMTRTEQKRERKELEGDPLIRGERQRITRQLITGPMRLGLRHAVVLVAGDDDIVGMRYVVGETPAPVVVSKTRGEACAAARGEAQHLGIPIVEDAALTVALARHGIGDFVRQEIYHPVAQILVRLGLT
jgi:type III secretion protein U